MRDSSRSFVCSLVLVTLVACVHDEATESHARMRPDAAVPSDAGEVGSNAGSGHRDHGAGGLVFDAGAGGTSHGGAGGELTDGEIGAVFKALNDVQLELGDELSKRALTPLVHDYVRMMLDEYTANQERQSGIFQRLDISPSEGPISQEFESDARRIRGDLDGAGHDIDLVYMQLQVELQSETLGLIGERLAPSAMHHTVETELTRLSVQLQQSLDRALQVLETLIPSGAEDAGT